MEARTCHWSLPTVPRHWCKNINNTFSVLFITRCVLLLNCPFFSFRSSTGQQKECQTTGNWQQRAEEGAVRGDRACANWSRAPPTQWAPGRGVPPGSCWSGDAPGYRRRKFLSQSAMDEEKGGEGLCQTKALLALLWGSKGVIFSWELVEVLTIQKNFLKLYLIAVYNVYRGWEGHFAEALLPLKWLHACVKNPHCLTKPFVVQNHFDEIH